MIPEKVCSCKSRQKAKIGIKEVLKSQCTLQQPSSFDLTFSYEIFHFKKYRTCGDGKSKVREELGKYILINMLNLKIHKIAF